ncbi:DNA-methyltransferase [Campylobacter jejuni]|uniref:DNA-methyltransferase n=1 Tax=Campylobacter jejuni TaxID=197 RepID=UPI0022423AA9|nr:site-specific DNA-methyltransferase [Campylobacter jejuni]
MSDYKIYNRDCIEFMQDMVNQGKKVDCIITDPPYLYLNHKLDRQFNEELFFELAGKITNKLVFFGRGDSFYKWNLLAKEQGFQFKEEIIWNKRHNTSPFHSLSRIHETISVRMKDGYIINKVKIDALRKHFNEDEFGVLLYDLKRVFSNVKNSDIIKDYLEKGEKILKISKVKHSITTSKYKKDSDRALNALDKYKEGVLLSSIITEKREHYTMEHPTQKPIKLLEKLVLLATNENETILDPFMGSGSTGLACLFKNRNFIGCEIDKEYFEIAERRLKSTQDTLKQNLFYGLDI